MTITSKILIFLSVMGLGGCMVTDAASKIGEKRTLKDSLYAFLSYPDNSKLVIIGEDYHYFLDPDRNLLNFLEIQNKPDVGVRFFHFKKDGKDISGAYNISIRKEQLDAEMISELVASGFKENLHHLVMFGVISGTLYASSQLEIEKASRFRKRYEIEIEQNPSSTAKLTKLAVSPLARVADVGIVVVGAGFVLVGVPVICISSDVIDIIHGNNLNNCNGF